MSIPPPSLSYLPPPPPLTAALTLPTCRLTFDTLDTENVIAHTKMGKTVGVVGLGRIGREVAAWCMNFGMYAVGYDPILTDAAARAAGIEPVSLDQVGDPVIGFAGFYWFTASRVGFEPRFFSCLCDCSCLGLSRARTEWHVHLCFLLLGIFSFHVPSSRKDRA